MWSLAAAFSGFLFGFDTAVISGAETSVQKLWGMSDFVHGLAVSMALWGTVIGALFSGRICEQFGRKPVLILIGVLYSVSAFGSALAWDPVSFMFFRFIGGLGVGASSIAAPAYIAEVSPEHSRGRLIASYQLNLVFGIFAALVSNYVIALFLPDADSWTYAWRIMLGVELIPALAFTFLVLVIPESPRWLARKGKPEEAKNILAQIVDKAEAERVFANLGSEAPVSSFRAILTRTYSIPLMLAVLIAFFNQVSGINAVLYYAPRIFELSGSSVNASLLSTVGIGLVNIIFTAVGMYAIDKLGRRKLMIIGSIGYILSLGTIAFGFAVSSFALVLPFIFLFIASHAIGQGAVIWVYISEIFPNEARTVGQAIGCGTHWVLAGVITLVMPLLLANLGASTVFLTFAGLMVLQLIFVLTWMVETKGKSLEALREELIKVDV